MKKVVFVFLFQADTTAIGYKIGHAIGGWVPFFVLAFILLLLTYKNWKRRNK